MFEQIEQVINDLKLIANKPEIFIGEDKCTFQFLNGFTFGAIGIIKLPVDYQAIFDEIVVENGWTISPSLKHRMIENGLSDREITRIIISLHIQTWEKILASLK